LFPVEWSWVQQYHRGLRPDGARVWPLHGVGSFRGERPDPPRPGHDSSGPGLLDSFGTPKQTDVETMYEFYLGAGSESSTLEADDIASLADLYPAAGFPGGSGTISGAV